MGVICFGLCGVVRSQTLTDIGSAAPTPGPNDIYQLSVSGYVAKPDGLNYYVDNPSPPGQTFTTGSSSTGYQLNSLSVRTAGGGGGGIANAQAYQLLIYSVTGSNATLLASCTSSASGASNQQWTFQSP